MTGRRIVFAWASIALVAVVGWFGGRVYADRFVASLDRDEVCASIDVALGDTVFRGAEQARRDSAELADRQCASRLRLARQGATNRVYLPLAIGAALATLL